MTIYYGTATIYYGTATIYYGTVAIYYGTVYNILRYSINILRYSTIYYGTVCNILRYSTIYYGTVVIYKKGGGCNVVWQQKGSVESITLAVVNCCVKMRQQMGTCSSQL